MMRKQAQEAQRKAANTWPSPLSPESFRDSVDDQGREIIMETDVIFQQERFCRKNGYECAPSDPNSRLGLAVKTLGQVPMNGLRHPPQGDTNGWYIWFGEKLSEDADFFAPLHVYHLPEDCPEIIRYLGLPPGYRFLIAGEYVDIWYDNSLLDARS